MKPPSGLQNMYAGSAEVDISLVKTLRKLLDYQPSITLKE